MDVAKITLSALVILASVSCQENATYRGHYVNAFEVSRFTPCGSSAKWWVTGDIRLLHAVDLPQKRGRATMLYVEIRGTHRWPGLYGHLNHYFHEVKVNEVVVARPAQPSDCR